MGVTYPPLTTTRNPRDAPRSLARSRVSCAHLPAGQGLGYCWRWSPADLPGKWWQPRVATLATEGVSDANR